MNCPNCAKEGSLRFVRAGTYVECVTPDCHWIQQPSDETVIAAALSTWLRENPAATLPRSCPDCGAGVVVVIGQTIAVCEANKHSSSLGAGDCRWELTLTPDLRRQADEALAAQEVA